MTHLQESWPAASPAAAASPRQTYKASPPGLRPPIFRMENPLRSPRSSPASAYDAGEEMREDTVGRLRWMDTPKCRHRPAPEPSVETHALFSCLRADAERTDMAATHGGSHGRARHHRTVRVGADVHGSDMDYRKNIFRSKNWKNCLYAINLAAFRKFIILTHISLTHVVYISVRNRDDILSKYS
ncbi:uncharacterized protein LOC133925095 [Phragmites australis]|uniref:uncharacterized protein LOC133925095 n=1 Tax=Phragmites australis TaxID=29695 RepID=UPI002D7854FD|nr:uncharacterized protein LOC133925095 [Phragmites australis]